MSRLRAPTQETCRSWSRQVGPLELGYEKLPVPDIDCMTLVVYHAEPGSKSAQSLALLASAIAEDPEPSKPLRSAG